MVDTTSFPVKTSLLLYHKMTVTDQMNRTVRLGAIPKRIVSLVPSQTEFLADLGLEKEVVGITKFCIHPKTWYKEKARIGGTKAVDIEKVRALKPDLIIGNKEENTREDIALLEEIAPVWMSDIYTLEDAYHMMELVGDICGCSNKAQDLVARIKAEFADLRPSLTPLSVAYLIWKDPYYVAGKRTFIDSILQAAGFVNYFDEERYPEWKGVGSPFEGVAPDCIFLSSEPYPFGDAHCTYFRKYVNSAHVRLVDGELFSWYGSRLLATPNYLKKIIEELNIAQ